MDTSKRAQKKVSDVSEGYMHDIHELIMRYNKASEYFSSEPERLNSPCGSQDFGPNHQKTFASEALIAADYSIVSAAAYPPEGNSRKRKSNEHTSGRSAKSGNRIISETELAKRDYLSGYGNQHHAVFPEPASNEITRPSRPHVNDGPTDKANEDLYSKGNLSHYSGSLSLFHDTKITDFLRESASNSLVLTSNQQKFATPATPIQIAKKQSSGSMHRSSQSPFEAVGLTTRDFPNGNASYDPGYPRTKHWELKITGLMEELTRVKEENKLLRAAIHHRDLYSQPIQTGPNFFTPSYQSMETIGDAALATDTQLPMGNQVWGAQSTEWDVTGGEGGLNWDVTDHAGYSEDAFYGEPPRTLAERYRLDF